MEVAIIIVGILLGIGCGLSFALAQRKQNMASGMRVIMLSFICITAAIIAVRSIAPQVVLPFGSLTAIAFLLSAVISVLLGHRRG